MKQHPRAILTGSSLKPTMTDWSQIYLLPRKVSVETRTRAFQFKILHNILYINQRLHKMGLAESPLYNLCGVSEETTTHLFLNCPITTHLWQTTQRKCSPSLTLPDINVFTVHLGFFSEPSDQKMMINQSNAWNAWRWRKYMWLAVQDGAITLGVSLHKEMTKIILVRGRTLQLEHRLLNHL